MYVNQTEGPYSIADDTLILQTTSSLTAAAFKKSATDSLPKQYQVKQWKRNSLDALVIRIDGKHAYWNNTIYLHLS